MKGKYLVSVFAMILLCSFVSAGIFGFIDGITGRASSQPTNVSVSVAGTTIAQIIYISPIPNIDANESSFRTVTFNVHMYDPDGVNDLNDTSVFANFTREGEAVRQTNGICPFVNDINGNTANYSCSIDMWYWDENGDWNISVRGRDVGNGSWTYNLSTTFQYNLLSAMIIFPNSLTWPTVSSGALNQTSNNDPTIVNNTGNYNGTIDLTAIDLYGETIPSQAIYAENFTGDINTGAGNPECIGTALVNATATTITGTIANRGNLSEGGGIGQEQIYYCIPNVPLVSSQTYSTSQGGSWIVSY